jgi:transcriptional regulator with XRE-family HTH domain
LGKIVSKTRQARLAYQVRMGRPVSIQEVATAIGVTRAHLSNIEHGKAWPSQEVLAKLCALYGIAVGDLLEYEERRALRTALAGHLTARRALSEATGSGGTVPVLPS